MIDYLPKGKSIGAMQASLHWISTHTVRFIGAVMITIGDGEGFILIKKGTPEGYYYQHGSKVLRGKSAFDFFSTQDLLSFRLQKYNAEEYRKALALYNGEQGSELTPASLDADIPAISVEPSPESFRPPSPPESPVQVDPYAGEPEVGPGEDAEPEPEESQDFVPDVRKILESAEESLDFSSSISDIAESSGSDDTLETPEDAEDMREPEGTADEQPPQLPDLSEQPAAQEQKEDAAESHETPLTEERQSPAYAEQEAAADDGEDAAQVEEAFLSSPEPRNFTMEDSEVADLGWILRRNGVLAAIVFSDGFSVVALGDADFEAVAAIAEDALRGAETIATAMDMGPFVQMTLQMKGKNVIIAPYRDTHICFLTSPKTHLGQIRGILQEISLRNSQQSA
jgi:predicted regulator of Ras-like GTPase activity (Roadblock/LC7/MglB family)